MATTHPIGKAFIVYGTVKAIAADGTERILVPNSPIYTGERIVTGPDGSVSIAFADSKGHLDLGRMSDVLVDQDIYGGAGPEGVSDSIAQTEDVQAALEQDPNFDPTTQLPGTAAGPGAVGTGTGAKGGGRQIVIFEPDNLAVTPDSGAETIGVGHNFLDPPGGIIPEEEAVLLAQTPSEPFNPPDNPPDDPPNEPVPHPIGPAERTVHESDLPDGSSPDGAALIVKGTLADLNVNFGTSTTGRLTFSDGQSIVIDRNGGDSITITGQYGNLIVNDDGTWSYTLEQNTLDHNKSGQVEFNDQVNDLFPFSATYPDGIKVSGGQILIHVLDDGPKIAVVGEGGAAVQEDALGNLNHGDNDADQSLGNLDGATDTDTVTIHLAAQLQFQFGADGPGSITYGITGFNGGGIDSGLTSKGVPVLYFQNGNVIEGRAGSIVVFTATLNTATGDLVFNLNDQLDHSFASGDDATIPVELGKFLQATITDAENGDSATASFAGSVVVTVENDVPVLALSTEGVTGAVQEDALGSTTMGNTADSDLSKGIAEGAPTDVVTLDLSGLVASAPGADEPVPVVFEVVNAGLPSGLTSQGKVVTYQVDAATNTLTAMADGRTVFTFVVDKATGVATFDLNDQLDHSFGVAGTDGETLSIDLGAWVQASVTDYDGDVATTNLNALVMVTVENDVPELILAEQGVIGAVQEDALGSTTLGNPDADESTGIPEGPATDEVTLQLGPLVQGVQSGADEQTTPVVFGFADIDGQDSGQTSKGTNVIYHQVDVNSVEAKAGNTVVFTLELNTATGELVFNLSDQLDHPTASGDLATIDIDLGQYLQASVSDYDGDVATANFSGLVTVSVENDVPTRGLGLKPPTPEVEEKGLLPNDASPTTANISLVSAATLCGVIPGADDPLSYHFQDVDSSYSTGLTHNTEKIIYSITKVGGTETLTASTENSNIDVFTFSLNSTTGDSEFTLHDYLDHNGSPKLLLNFGQLIQVTDADGDYVPLDGMVDVLVANYDLPTSSTQPSFMARGMSSPLTEQLDFESDVDGISTSLSSDNEEGGSGDDQSGDESLLGSGSDDATNDQESDIGDGGDGVAGDGGKNTETASKEEELAESDDSEKKEADDDGDADTDDGEKEVADDNGDADTDDDEEEVADNDGDTDSDAKGEEAADDGGETVADSKEEEMADEGDDNANEIADFDGGEESIDHLVPQPGSNPS